MSRILVTGARGFTGLHLSAALEKRGHEVMALEADLLDAESLKREVARTCPERIVHLAAIAFVAHGDVEAMYRVNIAGTRNLLAALANLPVRPACVLLASSANVYGNATEGVIDETAAPAPANDYAVSKLAMEYMARLWRDRLALTIVRPFNYIGQGQSTDFVIAKIADHIRRRAASIELGNLDVERDFSDVRMVVDAYVRLLELPEAPTGPLNVCSGQGTRLRDVIDLACEIGGHRPEILVNPAFVRANEVRRLLGSAAALESYIGPLDRKSLRESLAWILDS